MIGKRIRRGVRRARGSVGQLADSVLALSAYVVDADPERLLRLAGIAASADYLLDAREPGRAALADAGVEPGEKVATFGTRNLFGENLEDWQREMLATAARCPRARNPLEHYVLSWQENEQPSNTQAVEAVDILVDLLGAGHCQVLWSLHENTKNRHLHVMLIRIDPASGRAVAPGEGWDIDRLHQAVALIESRQGWASEPESLFIARDGAVFDRLTGRLVRDAAGGQRPRTPRRRNEPNIDRGRLESLGRLIEGSSGWTDLHRGLGKLGASYRRKGSGAILSIDGVDYKASALDPSWSRPALEKRFGCFVAASVEGRASYEDYCAAASAELKRIREAHSNARSRLTEVRDGALSAVGNGPAAGRLREAIQANFSSALTAVDIAFGTAKADFASARLSHADWASAGRPGRPNPATLPILLMPVPGTGIVARAAIPVGVSKSFLSLPGRDGTAYVDGHGRFAFTDHNFVVIVHQADLATVQAALLLAAGRWGSIRVFGSAEFLESSRRVATEFRLHVVDDKGRPLFIPSENSVKKQSSADIAPRPVQTGQQVVEEPMRKPPAGPEAVEEYSPAQLSFYAQRGVIPGR